MSELSELGRPSVACVSTIEYGRPGRNCEWSVSKSASVIGSFLRYQKSLGCRDEPWKKIPFQAESLKSEGVIRNISRKMKDPITIALPS